MSTYNIGDKFIGIGGSLVWIVVEVDEAGGIIAESIESDLHKPQIRIFWPDQIQSVG